jgi:hypothetical protein
MNRIFASVSRRVGTAMVVSTLALGVATAACSSESTSDAAAPASSVAASGATQPDNTAEVTPGAVERAVPTSAGGAAFAGGGGATTNCPSNTSGSAYSGVWVARDSKSFIASVTISFTDCNKLNTSRIRIVSHNWLGNANYSDWGVAKNTNWGYMGVSVTVTYYFQGLTERVRILPSTNGSGITTDGTESYANGTSRQLDKQRYGLYR